MKEEKIYAELLFVLEQLPSSYRNLIPQTLIDKFSKEMSQEWYLKFDKEKVFYKQNIQRDTILMLSLLYYKCLCKDETMKQEFIEMIYGVEN